MKQFKFNMRTYFLLIVTCCAILVSCAQTANKKINELENQTEKVIKTDEEWKTILTPEQYDVTRLKGTEKPFTGKFNDFKNDGVFICVCCGNPLFDSMTKFDSGTGWPSFYEPIGSQNVLLETDYSLGMSRTEALCNRCEAHLGHVFNDGPAPTGLRYCINSVALDFKERNK